MHLQPRPVSSHQSSFEFSFELVEWSISYLLQQWRERLSMFQLKIRIQHSEPVPESFIICHKDGKPYFRITLTAKLTFNCFWFWNFHGGQRVQLTDHANSCLECPSFTFCAIRLRRHVQTWLEGTDFADRSFDTSCPGLICSCGTQAAILGGRHPKAGLISSSLNLQDNRQSSLNFASLGTSRIPFWELGTTLFLLQNRSRSSPARYLEIWLVMEDVPWVLSRSTTDPISESIPSGRHLKQ